MRLGKKVYLQTDKEKLEEIRETIENNLNDAFPFNNDSFCLGYILGIITD